MWLGFNESRKYLAVYSIRAKFVYLYVGKKITIWSYLDLKSQTGKIKVQMIKQRRETLAGGFQS